MVTVAFMANAIRTYFGDGSEFGVRMVYATESTPLGTAGSVRNARDELDERFLVISGDVLTDIDLSRGGRLPRQARRAGHAGAQGGRESARVRDRDHPGGRLDRAVPREADLGPGLQRHHQHRDLRARAGDLRLHPRGPGRSTSRARRSRRRSTPGRTSSATWPTATGRTSGTLEAYLKAHQDILDRRVQVDIAGLPAPARGLVGQGCGDRPERRARRPGRHRRQLRRRARGQARASTARSGRNVRVGDNAVIERSVRPRQHVSRLRASGSRAACSGAGCDLRQGVRCEEGVVLGDECFVGAHAEIKAGVKVYPFKTVEAGAIVNSSIVWESRGARSLFGRDGVRGLANVDISPELAVRLSMAWASTLEKGATVTASRDTSRAARVLKRAIMVGLQRRRASTSTTSRRPRSRSPGSRSRPRPALAGITVRLAPDDPAVGGAPLLRRGGASTSTRPPNGRSSGSTTARTSAGSWPARSATSAFRPGPSSTTRPPSSTPSTCRRARHRPVSSWSSTTPSGRPASSCPTCSPSSRPRCWWSIPYANTAGVADLRPAGSAGPGGRAGAGVRGPPRRRHRPRRRVRRPSWTTGATS